MSGLNLTGGVKVNAGSGFSSNPAPATAAQAAFGNGYTSTGSASGLNALFPNDAFGIAFWTGSVALALLLVIRHSLPN